MARSRLIDRERIALLAVDQLQDMKAGAAAHQLGGDLPRLQRLHRADEQIGQAIGGARPDRAAAGAVVVFRDLARDDGEILAAADPTQGSLRALAALGDDRRGGTVGHGHKDLGDVELDARAGGVAALVDQGVDLGVADLDQVHHLALAHALDDQLVADAVAELVVGDAFLAQPLAQLGQRHLVLSRDVGDGTIELGIIDPRAGFARRGHEHALVDERVQHLLPEHRRRRRSAVRLRAASSRTRASRCAASLAVTSPVLTTATM